MDGTVDLINSIREKNNLESFKNPTDKPITTPYLSEFNKLLDVEKQKVYTTTPTIDVETNFNRLSDGTYIPKTETFLGNYGNEDRLARQQSSGEKWVNGLTKMVSKAGTYALDATVGTVYGLYKGVTEGSLEAVWNNDFSQYVDDLNTQLDGNLPNYYSDAEKNMSVWESLGTANFWANDFSNGLAFVGGNLLSGGITSVATGGLKMSTKLPQLALKVGGGKTAKQVYKSADDIIGASTKSSSKFVKKGIEKSGKIDEFNKAYAVKDIDKIVQATNKEILRSTTLGKVGKGIDIMAFSVRTGTFEAGMEARQNFNDSFDTFLQKFQEENGRTPNVEETQAFKDNATHAANWLFAGNMAILAPSNLAMFGKTAGIGLDLSNKLNTYTNKAVFGKGINFSKKAGTITAEAVKTTKLQKNLSRANSIFGKAATEGIYEEGFQGVAGKTMQNYLEAKYDPKSIGRDVSLWSSLYESFGEQYGSSEGWKEMFIGSLIGGIGAPALISSTEGKPGEFFKTAVQNITQSGVKEANESAAKSYNDAFISMQKKLSGSSALVESANKQSILTQGKSLDGKNSDIKIDYNEALQAESLSNFDYISVMEGHLDDKGILKDYEYLVDNLNISEEAKKQGITEDQFEEYKDELKSKFSDSLKSARQAKNAAEALGLGVYVDSNGNSREATDVIARTIYDGIESLPNAKRVANQLDQALGEEGIFSTLNAMNSLTSEQQKLASEFATLKEEKVRKEKLSLELQRKVEAQSLRTDRVTQGGNKGGIATSEKALLKRREEQLKNAEALARINEEIINSNERLAEIKGELSITSKVDNVGLSNLYGATSEGLVGFDIEQALEKLDNIDKFTNQLRNSGRERDAEVIDQLTNDFLGYATKARNLQYLHRQMLDPQFFKKKKGRTMLSDILGKKYQISKELKEKLDENNNRIIDVLAKKGMLKNPEAVTLNDLVENNVVNNTELSDREKFRMENILKAQLLQLNILDTALVAEEINNTIVPVNVVKGGDTVKFSRELNDVLKDSNLTNSQQLEKLISTIIKEVNNIFDIKGREISTDDINKLESKYNVNIEKNIDGTFNVTPKIGEVQEVTDEIYNSFVDTGEVSDEVLNGLAYKRMNRDDLTIQEKAIDVEFGLKINKKLEGVTQAESELNTIKSPGFKVLKSNEFKRLEELTNKQIKNEELSDDEISELDQLKTDFDRWTLAEGTVVNGVRLSDLIKRKLNYENLSVETEDDIFSLDGYESMSLADFESRSSDNYYFLAQSAINATVIRQKDGIAIHNISAGELANIMGAVVSNKDPDPNTQVEFTIKIKDGQENIVANLDQKGNLIFNEDDIDLINKNTNLIIEPTNKDVSSKYSVLLQKDIEGNIRPVESDYNYQGETIDQEAIYGLKNGEKLTVKVDPKDEYNKKLLDSLTEIVIPSEIKINTELKSRLKKNEDYQDAIGMINGFKEGTLQFQEGKDIEFEIFNKTREEVIKDITTERVNSFTEENKNLLINNMVIKLYKGNSLLGVMKGIRNSEFITEKDQQFELARQAIIRSNLVKLTDGSNDFIISDEVEVTVSDVFLGHPNYNFVEGEQGLGTKFNDISNINAEKIVDIGYLEDGEIVLKDSTKDIDTTYLSKLKRKTGKQPVAIISFSNKNVAYPVNIKNRDKSAIVDEIEAILDGNKSMIEKGIEIDKRLALLGIDPNVKGQSLEYFSNSNNTFNSENIQNFLAFVKNNPYLYSLDNWFKPELSLDTIVTNQIQINLNLEEPFHSPKFKMNFPTIDIPSPDTDNNKKAKKQSISPTLETQQAIDTLKC